MKTAAIIVGGLVAYCLLAVPLFMVLGRVVRAGTAHLDRPLPPESMRNGTWGGPRI